MIPTLNDKETLEKLIEAGEDIDRVKLFGDKRGFWKKFVHEYDMFGLPKDRLHIINIDNISQDHSYEYNPKTRQRDYVPHLITERCPETDKPIETYGFYDGNGFTDMFYDDGHQFIFGRNLKRDQSKDHDFLMNEDEYIYITHECTHYLYSLYLEDETGHPVSKYPNFALGHNSKQHNPFCFQGDSLTLGDNFIDLGDYSDEIEGEVCYLQMFLLLSLGLLHKRSASGRLSVEHLDDLLYTYSAPCVSEDDAFQMGRDIYFERGINRFVSKKIDERCVARRSY